MKRLSEGVFIYFSRSQLQVISEANQTGLEKLKMNWTDFIRESEG